MEITRFVQWIRVYIRKFEIAWHNFKKTIIFWCNKYLSMRELTHAEAEKAFHKLMEDPLNNLCFECRAKRPSWASLNLGIFLCMNCAGWDWNRQASIIWGALFLCALTNPGFMEHCLIGFLYFWRECRSRLVFQIVGVGLRELWEKNVDLWEIRATSGLEVIVELRIK